MLADPPKELFQKTNKGLKHIIKHFMKSQVDQLDIWDINLECEESGAIQRYEKDKKGKARIVNLSVPDPKDPGKSVKMTKMERRMSNYFSIGVDARIGFNFERKRKKSRIGNKIIYFLEGMKRLCSPQLKVTDVVQKMEVIKDGDDSQSEYSERNLLSTQFSVKESTLVLANLFRLRHHGQGTQQLGGQHRGFFRSAPLTRAAEVHDPGQVRLAGL
jgi:diacylglycerol kinase (ATP)